MKRSELKKLIQEETAKVLNEQMTVQNMVGLEQMSNKFASVLMQKGIIKSYHKDLTSSDVQANQYTEDLGEIIRNSVQHWVDVVNKRAGR